jgi:hypothetical protein
MHMAVDEPRDHDFAARVDFRLAAVFVACANNSVVANCDISVIEVTRDQVERARVPDHQIGAGIPEGLVDPPFQSSPTCVHRHHFRCVRP